MPIPLSVCVKATLDTGNMLVHVLLFFSLCKNQTRDIRFDAQNPLFLFHISIQ